MTPAESSQLSMSRAVDVLVMSHGTMCMFSFLSSHLLCMYIQVCYTQDQHYRVLQLLMFGDPVQNVLRG